MLRDQLLLFGRKKSPSSKTAKKRPHSFKPMLEELEPRVVLSTAADNAAFVGALYKDFLHRSGDTTNPADAGHWAVALNTGTLTRSQVATDIVHSPESLTHQVDGLYEKILNRQADPGGQAAFVNFLAKGGTLEQVETDMFSSPEFAAHAGADAGFIESLYIRALGRAGNPAEVQGWEKALPSLGRAGVVGAFLASNEFRDNAVRQLYDGASTQTASVASVLPNLLQRTGSPAAGEVNGWASSGLDQLSEQTAFASTDEFFRNAVEKFTTTDQGLTSQPSEQTQKGTVTIASQTAPHYVVPPPTQAQLQAIANVQAQKLEANGTASASAAEQIQKGAVTTTSQTGQYVTAGSFRFYLSQQVDQSPTVHAQVQVPQIVYVPAGAGLSVPVSYAAYHSKNPRAQAEQEFMQGGMSWRGELIFNAVAYLPGSDAPGWSQFAKTYLQAPTLPHETIGGQDVIDYPTSAYLPYWLYRTWDTYGYSSKNAQNVVAHLSSADPIKELAEKIIDDHSNGWVGRPGLSKSEERELHAANIDQLLSTADGDVYFNYGGSSSNYLNDLIHQYFILSNGQPQQSFLDIAKADAQAAKASDLSASLLGALANTPLGSWIQKQIINPVTSFELGNWDGIVAMAKGVASTLQQQVEEPLKDYPLWLLKTVAGAGNPLMVDQVMGLGNALTHLGGNDDVQGPRQAGQQPLDKIWSDVKQYWDNDHARFLGRASFEIAMVLVPVGEWAKAAKAVKAAETAKAAGQISETAEVTELQQVSEGLKEILGAKAQTLESDLITSETLESGGAPAGTEGPTKFANWWTQLDHYARHGSDFGAESAAEYESMADAFLNGPREPTVLELTRPNKDIVRFDPATEAFGVRTPDGTIRTFYKPDPAVHKYPTNLDYFNAQK